MNDIIKMNRNPITGDLLKTKAPTEEYKDGWERIFGNKRPKDVHLNNHLEPSNEHPRVLTNDVP